MKCSWLAGSKVGAPTFVANFETGSTANLATTYDLHYVEYNTGTYNSP